MTITIHVPKTEPFDDSLFYESDTLIATVTGPHGTFEVFCEGRVYAVHEGRELRNAEDFRQAFPTGEIPDGLDVGNNNWFAVVKRGGNGDEEEACEGYASAIHTAEEAAGIKPREGPYSCEQPECDETGGTDHMVRLFRELWFCPSHAVDQLRRARQERELTPEETEVLREREPGCAGVKA